MTALSIIAATLSVVVFLGAILGLAMIADRFRMKDKLAKKDHQISSLALDLYERETQLAWAQHEKDEQFHLRMAAESDVRIIQETLTQQQLALAAKIDELEMTKATLVTREQQILDHAFETNLLKGRISELEQANLELSVTK